MDVFGQRGGLTGKFLLMAFAKYALPHIVGSGDILVGVELADSRQLHSFGQLGLDGQQVFCHVHHYFSSSYSGLSSRSCFLGALCS